MTPALLAGLLAAPAFLVWAGHRLRRRSPRVRGAFWGGLLGHSLGMLVTLAAAHYPPVHWDGSPWRTAAVHASMLLGTVLGAAVGALASGATEVAATTAGSPPSRTGRGAGS